MSTSRFPPVSVLSTNITGLTTKRLVYGSSAGLVSQSALLTFDDTIASLSLTGTISKVSAAGSTWDALTMPASTLTLTGGTSVTTATGLNTVSLYGSTITSSSATTVTYAAAMYVGAAPAGAGSVTITNAYGLWVDSGATRLDGNVIIGGSATVPLPTTILHVVGSSVSTQDVLNINMDNTNAASHARIRATSGGASGGDPTYMATVTSATDWIWGIDNSVAGDPWVLAAAAALGTAATDVLTVTTAGSVVCGGQAALATNATTGFLYIPTCAGTPSGVPASFTGKVAIVYDTSANKFMVYNAAWKGGTAPGAWT